MILRESIIFAILFLGELPEWLKEQFAKLSTRNRCVGSNPTLSAEEHSLIYCGEKIEMYKGRWHCSFTP